MGDVLDLEQPGAALDGDATGAQAPAKFRRRSSPSDVGQGLAPHVKVLASSTGKVTSPGVVVLSPSLPDGEDDDDDQGGLEDKRVPAPVAETSAQNVVQRPVFVFGRGRFPAVRPPVGAESHVED